jgi:hypothetical protein
MLKGWVSRCAARLARAENPLSFMNHPASFTSARGLLPDQEQKQAALGYLNEAWAEARHDGIDGDCLAQASLFAAFAELVRTYGEDAVAKFVEGLPARVRNGEFSTGLAKQ